MTGLTTRLMTRLTTRRLLLLVAFALALPAFAAGAPKRYVVATRRPVRQLALQMLRDVESAAAHGVRSFESVQGFAADLTDDEAAALRGTKDVLFVTAVVERHLLDTQRPVRPAPRDARSSASAARPLPHAVLAMQVVPYGIDLVHAREVWPVTRGGGGLINVAVLDTGIDTKHPDLYPNYAGGFNTFTQSNDPTDDNYHGTHVSGTIAARDNAFGVVGVAPETHIWAVKVLDGSGNGTDETVIAGINWVLAKKQEIGGQWVMSLSLGSSDSSPVEEAAFAKASDAGILTFAASGNDGKSVINFPAAYASVSSVGAVDSRRVRASFSTYGPTLTFVAPGVNVLSTVPEGNLISTSLFVDGQEVAAYPLIGTGRAAIRAPVIDCGFGAAGQFPASVRGNLALIKRGAMLSFADKTKNAIAAGAAGVIIYNDDDVGKTDWDRFTLLRQVCDPKCHALAEDLAYPWPMALSVSNVDGEGLRKLPAGTVVQASITADQYAVLDGTSMSTPHVSGVAALIWAVAPVATAAEVLQSMEATATDLGAAGYDPFYGFGLPNALEAAKRLNPAAFLGGTPPPAVTPPHRRTVGH